MLGYTQSNSDIYVFFEKDELKRLEKEKIQGTYFNLSDPSVTGLLEMSISDEIGMEIIKTSGEKNDEGFITRLHLEIRLRQYQILLDRKSFGLHEGFRHINLLDANDLNHEDELNYRQLKHWESQQSN